MTQIDLHTSDGEKKGAITLPKEIFGQDVNAALLAQAVHIYRINHSSHTSHTKTRSDVSGGGRKPWRQKGTGRARQGSTRQPQRRGGGIVFGPRAFKSRVQKLTKKMRRAAIISSFSLKAESKNIVAVDKLEITTPKTSQIAALLSKLPLEKTTLLLLSKNDKLLQKACNNIPNLKLLFIDNVNVYEILKSKTLLLTQDTIKVLEQRYGSAKPAKVAEKKEVADQKKTATPKSAQKS